VAVLAGALGVVAGTAAKIAGDVILLAQTEVHEAHEHDAGGSSALPQKRNPAASVAAVAAARRAHALLPVLFSALVAEHERAAGAWHAEWQSLSQLLALAGGAARRTADVIDSLQLDPGAMMANLDAQDGTLLSERLLLAVTAITGDRDAAGRAIERARRAASPGFAAALAADPVISGVLDPSQIGELLDPAGYLGAARIWIDRALASYEATAP
jgi:3-carboxy-cis,cis-muconate cycloisomerase